MREKEEGRHKSLTDFFLELLELWQFFLSLVTFQASLPVFPVIEPLIQIQDTEVFQQFIKMSTNSGPFLRVNSHLFWSEAGRQQRNKKPN